MEMMEAGGGHDTGRSGGRNMDDIKIKISKSDYPKFRDFVRLAFQPKYILGDEKFLDWQYASPGGVFFAKRGKK